MRLVRFGPALSRRLHQTGEDCILHPVHVANDFVWLRRVSLIGRPAPHAIRVSVGRRLCRWRHSRSSPVAYRGLQKGRARGRVIDMVALRSSQAVWRPVERLQLVLNGLAAIGGGNPHIEGATRLVEAARCRTASHGSDIRHAIPSVPDLAADSSTSADQGAGGYFRAAPIWVLHSVSEPNREASMAKAYWIATYRSINDPEALAAYAKLAGPAIWAAGGRNLVRGTPAKTLEAGMDLRTVVIEFDSVESAMAAYGSPEYQAARKLLGDTAVRDIRIVEGSE